MELLTDFMAELVNDGELTLARALRTKFIQKFEDRKLRLLPDLDTSGLSFSQKPTSLLSFKSVELAEQMTLLDAQLFLRLGKMIYACQFFFAKTKNKKKCLQKSFLQKIGYKKLIST